MKEVGWLSCRCIFGGQLETGEGDVVHTTMMDVQNITTFLGNPMFLLFDHILFHCGKKVKE